MTGVVLAGGGLANSLIALRLRALRPDVPIVLLERGRTIGGNHTWSFHEGDVNAGARPWLQPLIAHSWPAQQVRFPGLRRRLATPYHSITAARLHDVVCGALGAQARCGVEIVELRPDGARLATGETLSGTLVIDGRGLPPVRHFDLRWQKFVGLELELGATHGLDAPVLMDATVPQLDGYRFVYVLPLAPRRVLIEDTYYSDTPGLRVEELRARVHEYAATSGLQVARVVREETGVLPIVLDGDVRAFWAEVGVAIPRAGMSAMLCHHTTGYSLPEAVRVAELVAAAPVLASAPVAQAVRDLALERWRQQRFFRLLNRLMFEAAEPAGRYRTLEHFYRCPEALIGRFYAGRLRPLDGLRLLTGRPPVPVGRALRCIARGLRRTEVTPATGRPGRGA